MQIICGACALAADATLGTEGYTIAFPHCFTLRCPQISKQMMNEGGGCSECDRCKFMERAAERAFVNYMTRQ